MMRRAIRAAWFLVAGVTPAVAGGWTHSSSVAVEQRAFASAPAAPGQHGGDQGSVALAADWRWVGGSRRHQLGFVPFARLDGRDDERSHVDLREAYWRYSGKVWEVLAGLDRVFWGVAESRHLVDTINQVDLVEDPDGEDRLGQPMVAVGIQRPWGRLEAFALTGFRERTFPGARGRLGPGLEVEDDAVYASGRGRRRIDLALRYSHFVGEWDIGVHGFHGTGREPRLVPNRRGALTPHYDVTRQAGLDLQRTSGPWLLKFEGLIRSGQGRTFGAWVGGFEHTIYGVGGSAADLGLLLEYLHDGRDPTAPPTPFDDDVFAGVRLALNDSQGTSLLVGAVVDRHDGSVTTRLEAARRLGARTTLEIEARGFAGVGPGNGLAPVAGDAHVTARLAVFF